MCRLHFDFSAATAILLALPLFARADAKLDSPASSRQALEQAWWTGPLLAASPTALPPGDVVIESYAYDSRVTSRFDNSGRRRVVGRSDYVGSLTSIFAGLSSHLTAGAYLRIGYARLSEALNSARVGLGDTTLQAQYQVRAWRPGDTLPTISLVVSETFPTGKFDQLENGAGDGLGAGAYATTLALYTQRLFWMPTGRLLRSRLNVSYSFAQRVRIRDASVYGTRTGFRGVAQPGPTFEADWSAEYSFTSHWVAAIDLDYLHGGSSRIAGSYRTSDPRAGPITPAVERIDASYLVSAAPAIEYNFNSNIGVIIGVQMPVSGRNASASITPTVAVSIAF